MTRPAPHRGTTGRRLAAELSRPQHSALLVGDREDGLPHGGGIARSGPWIRSFDGDVGARRGDEDLPPEPRLHRLGQRARTDAALRAAKTRPAERLRTDGAAIAGAVTRRRGRVRGKDGRAGRSEGMREEDVSASGVFWQEPSPPSAIPTNLRS